MINYKFAYAEGTTFTAVENATPTSMYIADVNKLMLVVVNRFLIMTADQLSNYLVNTLHLEGMNAADIEKQLQLMTRANFLTEYDFRNSEDQLMYSAYGLGYRGRGLLKAMNEAPRMTGFIAQLDAYLAMKLLSSNQYAVTPAATKKNSTARQITRIFRFMLPPYTTIQSKQSDCFDSPDAAASGAPHEMRGEFVRTISDPCKP